MSKPPIVDWRISDLCLFLFLTTKKHFTKKGTGDLDFIDILTLLMCFSILYLSNFSVLHFFSPGQSPNALHEPVGVCVAFSAHLKIKEKHETLLLSSPQNIQILKKVGQILK